jgi:lipopolysaccharide export LptBFGC system permease protein LptF
VPALRPRYPAGVRIIARYLLLDFVFASCAVFFGLIAMWLAADVLLHADDLAGHVASGLREVALRGFPVLPIAVPLSGLVGAVMTVTRAARNRELTAIRSGGIRVQYALAPLLALSLLASLGVCVLQDRVLLPLRVAFERARTERDTGGFRSPERVLKRWWFSSGSSIFSASAYDPDERSMRDVTVFLFDADRSIRERIDAKTAQSLDGDTWEIRDAHVLDFSAQNGLARHDAATLRLNLGITGKEMSHAADTALLGSLRQLARQIRKSAGDAAEVAKLELAFHGRLAEPLILLVAVLFAIPFAAGDGRGADSLPGALLRALLAAALFYVAWSMALFVARSGTLSPSLAVWGVMASALALGYWRYRRIPE